MWLDGFDSEWFSNQVIGDLLSQDKQVCVVSPELHGRDCMALWQQLLEFRSENRLTLCTDTPVDAAIFFK
ncbi:hypothetical protein ALP29_200863 [Pseudomonas syringae pv. avii]|uniref:Uncharacterized protein n=1 Tax=Pseudomonas syringae pv. avii TaxID=663959 RepID=A0A3M5TWU3_PSESX|nr:hypothetical protein ALP29_200863 [Pseudomonas syringae pv. avii]